MSKIMSKKFAAPCLAVFLALCALLLAPRAAAAEMTRADVEKIIAEYIEEHPQDILDAVNNWQMRASREAQEEAVRKNSHKIYSDKMTPVAGNPDGDVTLVEFFDYNCGYCKKSLPQILDLIEADANLRVIFKELPILGPSSEDAAKWALAAHRQGKYFEFHQALMKNHKPIGTALLREIGKKVGLDVERAQSDTASADVVAQIERNRILASDMEIRGTPAFIVGEKVAPGAVGIAELKRLIAETREAKKDGKKDDSKKDE